MRLDENSSIAQPSHPENDLKHIICDLDDVLSHSANFIFIELNRLTGQSSTADEIRSFNLTTTFPDLTDDMINQNMIDTNLISNVLPVAEAPHALYLLRESGYKIHIATARGFHPDAHTLTAEWLTRNKMPYDSLTITPFRGNKLEHIGHHYYEYEYMIDDHLQNIEDARTSGKVLHPIVIDKGWNQHEDYVHGVNRFGSIMEFAKHVEEISR